MSDEANNQSDIEPNSLGPDEIFCTECGDIIKERAEMCPNCGVRQSGQSTGLTDRRKYELESIASKNTTTVVLLGILLTPVAYWIIGKRGLALINLITFNFLLFGFFIVPIHSYRIVSNAREELRKAGVQGY